LSSVGGEGERDLIADGLKKKTSNPLTGGLPAEVFWESRGGKREERKKTGAPYFFGGADHEVQ